MKNLFLLVIVLYCSLATVYAQRTITGTVLESKTPDAVLPGVTVQVVGTTRGTITDGDGKYAIQVRPGDKELTFCSLGMKCKTITIGDKTEIDVVLEPDVVAIDEVVVSALGIRRESKSLTVAQQRVDAAKMTEVRDANLVSSLAGKVAGVVVTPPSSSTGSARIVIRGNSSFTGNNQPLFVVDGMAIDNSDGSAGVGTNGGLDMGNGAADINPDDIESLDILKGPNAAALYGSRAANGVIIITTKKAKEGRFKVSMNSNTMFRYITQWPEFQNSFGMGHLTRMVGGNSQWLTTADPSGNLYPYPGIPDMTEINTDQGGRSNGGPMIGIPYIGLDGNTYSYSPQPENVYDFYQRASTFTNNIAVEGGNADNNYRVSFTNSSADDVVQKQNVVNKNTTTLRFYNTLAKKLTLDSKITFINDKTENRRYANQSSYNPLYMYTILSRSMTLDQLQYYKNALGSETVMVGGIHNPYWTINETSNEDTKMRYMINFDLSYQIIPSLKATLKYGRDYIDTNSSEFRNKGALGGVNDASGYYRRQYNKTDNSHYEWILLYNDRFLQDNLSITGSFGGSQLDYNGSWLSASLESLKQPGFQHISNSDNPPLSDEDVRSTKRLRGLYGSLSIGVKDY
ncbi:MAG TPA: TonB-dependent receptor plug domain-containing protein, partial [Prolixibacteraceae bacterium]|nr:TonB-dependent receptor plug domain-containing protein [Prolixibacteraceae bacterium]